MQVGELHNSDVAEYTSRVLVNGRHHTVAEWSIDRELTGHLPSQVVHGAGLIQATGTIRWALSSDVARYASNPWNRGVDWVPQHGDRIEIFAGDGQTEWKQFHGLVDKTTGSVGEGFTSTIVDDVDKLSARVSHLPMLRFMPPSSPGGLHRGVGLTSSYYVNFALRQSGFFATPRNEPNAVLSVPAQGSMWPDQGLVGGLIDGLGKEPGYIHAQNFPAPWGWSVGNLDYTYRPRNQNTTSTPVQLTVMVAPNHAGNFTMNAHYGNATVGLAIWAERYPAAYINGSSVVSISSADFADATIVTMLYKNGTVTLRADNGATATGSASASSSTPMERIVLDGDRDARVAGMQVSHPATTAQEFSSLNFEPSATLDMRNAQFMDLMDAGPRIENQRIRELLNEISESTLSAMWIDEAGVMRWVPSPTLRAQPVSQTMTTKSDLLSLRWEDSLLGARSMVTVKGRNCAISRSQWNSVLLYEASSRTMDSGSLLEDFVSPGSDEEWVLPDESMAVLDETSWGSYNSGRGTYGGAHFTRDNEEVPSGSASVAISMERLGINRYKITHQASDFSTNLKAHLATSQVAPVLWDANRSRPLPVVRGMGRVDWIDVESTPITVGGPGPELVHDAGMWNNRQTNLEPLESMASYIAAHTSVPEPTIQGMDVFFDPRRQLADVVNIRSDDYMGVTLRVLITGISTRFTGELYEQSINGQVISVTTSAATFHEWERSYPNTLTFSQWRSLRSLNDTWGDFNQNPMKGAIS